VEGGGVSVLRGACIELWVEERGGAPAVNAVMAALLAELAAAGARVAAVVPEQEAFDPRVPRRPDLVLLKTPTTLGLAMAQAYEAAGVRFLNPARATVRAHDKAAVVGRLAAAGVPVPVTFLNAGSGDLPLPGMWIAKPTRGVHGVGVSGHARLADAVAAIPPAGRHGWIAADGTGLVQARVGRPEEPDVKVYLAGEALFAGRKRFSATSFRSDAIEPAALGERAAAVVRAAAHALELPLLGVDLRIEGGEPVVIDANPFPGFRGFPTAVAALRAHVERALEAA
jgi:ribosomal protein S6--L-glutamate ligase